MQICCFATAVVLPCKALAFKQGFLNGTCIAKIVSFFKKTT